MPNLRLFTDKMSHSNSGGPSATVAKDHGRITFNRSAITLISDGKPVDAIEFLVDPDEQIIGFRPADRAKRHSYLLHKLGGKQSPGTGMGVAALGVLRSIGYKPDVRRRYTVEMIDGIACVDLKQPEGVDPHHGLSNARTRRKATPQRALLPDDAAAGD